LQYKYLLTNDADVHDKTHLQFFEHINDCNAYMLKHKLHTTHLVYDLTTAKCVNTFESKNDTIVHL